MTSLSSLSSDAEHNARGAMIVVEGLDRAGKSSQCEMLQASLEKMGKSVQYIKFPGYSLHNFPKQDDTNNLSSFRPHNTHRNPNRPIPPFQNHPSRPHNPPPLQFQPMGTRLEDPISDRKRHNPHHRSLLLLRRSLQRCQGSPKSDARLGMAA